MTIQITVSKPTPEGESYQEILEQMTLFVAKLAAKGHGVSAHANYTSGGETKYASLSLSPITPYVSG